MIARQERTPAVAGTFYPADPGILRETVRGLLREAAPAWPFPKALIVPHAGFAYSGPVAASAYVLLKNSAQEIRRVVLLGPSHRVRFHGLAISSDDEFATPLGSVPLDLKAIQSAMRLPQVHLNDEAHRREHSLEVQIPFLQTVLGRFSLVPIAIGLTSVEEVAGVLRHLWDGDDTLIVVSSDLSHFLDYPNARGMDSETSHYIEHFELEQLDGQRACGYRGIQGLLRIAQEQQLHVKTIDLRNSGDMTDERGPVVGYGSFVAYT